VKEKIVRLRTAMASGQFPLYVLAVVGVLTIPYAWCVPLIALTVALQLITSQKVLNTDISKFWRTNESQRIMIGGALIWLFAYLRTEAVSFLVGDKHVSGILQVSNSAYMALMSAILATVCFYTFALLVSVRTCPRGIGSQHDRKLQKWTDNTFSGFCLTFAGVIFAVCLTSGGVLDQIGNWLASSAFDANLVYWADFARQVPAQPILVVTVKLVTAFVTTTLFWSRGVQISAFLTALAKQVAISPATKFGDTFLRVFHAPRTVLKLREKQPFLKNAASTFLYLLFWYGLLFWLCAFCPGALGDAIGNWLLASVKDSGLIPSMEFVGGPYSFGTPPDVETLDRVRVFCAAIVALYGTVPAAIMSAPFLPYAKRRELHLTEDGVVFANSRFVGGRMKQMLLWSNFAHVDVVRKKKQAQGKIVLKFHTGGKVVLSEKQLDPRSLDKLLGAIDEHAQNCVVTDAVVALRAEIRAKMANDGKQSELGSLSAQNFQSTIFVPHDLGTWLPNGEARVVRLLASRPLSCVYLVRLNTGELAIAKQFFLADDNEQAQALRKTFQREYELLKAIDHPRVSKVLEVFERDESTYLLLEHASGIDLRKLVGIEGAQPESVVIDWALQICDIISALHDQDPPIVHRDLTPDNLILAEDGSLRIIDFGAAHQFMEGITGTIIGKQCYVPPEQLRGQAGPASDVYSFGCTLFYLLTGSEPTALTQCNPKSIESVSDEINQLVMRCTEFDDAARPQTFAELRETLVEMKHGRQPKEVLKKFAEAVMEISDEELAAEEAGSQLEPESVVIHLTETEKVAEWN
jgi:hypothetical protein